MNANSCRWGLTTFALGISSGILGHYLPVEVWFFPVLVLSGFFGMFGALAIAENETVGGE